MKQIKFLLIAIICSYNLHAQIVPAWATTYVSNYPMSITQRDMTTDKNGNVYIVGYTNDTSYNNTNTVILKYNSFGQFQWIQQYDSINYYTKITVDNIGNAYILGHSNNKLLTIKYNTQGVLQWVNFYTSSTTYCWPSDIITDNTGNVYIIGTSHNNNFVTVKYNTSGVLMWDAIDSQAMGQSNGFITLDNYGNVYIAIRGNDSTHASTSNIIKYNNSGIKKWESVYTSNFNPGLSGPADLKFDKNGFIYLLAGTSNNNNGDGDYAIVKYDTTGNHIWTTTYSFSNYYDNPNSLVVDKLGNSYITGSIYQTGGTVDSIATIKITASGLFKWRKTYSLGYSNNDEASGMAMDSLGYIYVGGVSSDNFNHENFITIKYDSLGNEIWLGRYKTTMYSNDYGNSISLDKFGNIYVCGTTLDINSSGISTIKYSNNVGILESQKNVINLFPNPVTSILNITDEQNQLQNSTVSIINYLGQTILSLPFTEHVDVSKLADGFYTIKIKASDGVVFTAKFIKE